MLQINSQHKIHFMNTHRSKIKGKKKRNKNKNYKSNLLIKFKKSQGIKMKRKDSMAGNNRINAHIFSLIKGVNKAMMMTQYKP